MESTAVGLHGYGVLEATSTPDPSMPECVLMVSCISVRNTSDSKIIPKEKLSRIRIYPSCGSHSKQFISADLIDHISIGLTDDDLMGDSYKLMISFGDQASTQPIKVPLHMTGCRYSHFLIESLQMTVCLVHDILEVQSDTDLFIEEQDFLYNCMNIQEELFLRKTIVDTSICADVMQPCPVQVPPPATDVERLACELEVMNSLIAKYERAKAVSVDP